MIYMIFSFLFLFLHVLMIFFCFILSSSMIILDFFFMPFMFLNFNLMFLFDLFSISFSSVVFLISGVVVFYSYFYMKGDLKIERYFFLLLMFVASMLVLIFSSNLVSVLLGWDGLGLTSFCLIVYYGGFTSVRSGLVSIFINRLGDMGLIICLFLMGTKGFWDFFLTFDSFTLVSILFMLSSMTKSAQLPFSSWLPAAMAAPTPISSLVHSSTLVTAGVYLLFRYNYYFFFFLNSLIFSFLSLSTMVMAGVIALVETDMKKVIAMSTLSQLGLMMFMLSLGEVFFCFFHMLTHAMFKSLLFLSCGGVMMYSSGNQDYRLKGLASFIGPNHSLLFCVSSLSLIGFPFLAGFFSKDLCLDVLLEFNMGFLTFLLFILGCVLTVFYSLRIFFFGLNSASLLSSTLNLRYSSFSSFCFFLMFFSVSGGKIYGFLFLMDDVIFSFSFLKMIGCFLIILGILFFYFNNLVSFDFFFSMFSMDLVFGHFLSRFFFSKKFFFSVDLTWVEMLGPFGALKAIYAMSYYFREFEKNFFFFKSFFFFSLYVIFIIMLFLLLKA